MNGLHAPARIEDLHSLLKRGFLATVSDNGRLSVICHGLVTAESHKISLLRDLIASACACVMLFRLRIRCILLWTVFGCLIVISSAVATSLITAYLLLWVLFLPRLNYPPVTQRNNNQHSCRLQLELLRHELRRILPGDRSDFLSAQSHRNLQCVKSNSLF